MNQRPEVLSVSGDPLAPWRRIECDLQVYCRLLEPFVLLQVDRFLQYTELLRHGHIRTQMLRVESVARYTVTFSVALVLIAGASLWLRRPSRVRDMIGSGDRWGGSDAPSNWQLARSIIKSQANPARFSLLSVLDEGSINSSALIIATRVLGSPAPVIVGKLVHATAATLEFPALFEVKPMSDPSHGTKARLPAAASRHSLPAKPVAAGAGSRHSHGRGLLGMLLDVAGGSGKAQASLLTGKRHGGAASSNDHRRGTGTPDSSRHRDFHSPKGGLTPLPGRTNSASNTHTAPVFPSSQRETTCATRLPWGDAGSCSAKSAGLNSPLLAVTPTVARCTEGRHGAVLILYGVTGISTGDLAMAASPDPTRWPECLAQAPGLKLIPDHSLRSIVAQLARRRLAAIVLVL